jgi:hypothetical protein
MKARRSERRFRKRPVSAVELAACASLERVGVRAQQDDADVDRFGASAIGA